MIKALGYYLSIPFIYFISILPLPVLYFISDYLLYPILYKILKYRKKVVSENLKRSFPEKSDQERLEIEIKFYRFLCDLFVETVKGFTISNEELKRRITFTESPDLEKWYNQGRNCIITVGHKCNYEWICRVLPLFTSYHIKVPYRKFTNPYFDKLFTKARGQLGVELFPTFDTFKELKKQVSKPFMLGLANDQSAHPDKSFWTRFLNQDTSFYVGAEKIAVSLDMPVIYGKLEYIERGRYHISFEAIEEFPKNSQEGHILNKHANLLERDILESPEYWLWSHRRWKHKMPAGIPYGFNIKSKTS